jgi:hypothetical protein
LGLFVALLGVVVLTACDRMQDKAAERLVEKVLAENGRRATVDVDHERGEISVTLGGVAPPEGWPGEVPIYPDALRAHVDSKSEDHVRLSVMTTEPMRKLADYYRRELPSLGWRMTDAHGTELMRAERGDLRLTARFSEGSAGTGSRVRIELARPG